MFGKNWSRYLIELIWVAIIILRIIVQLFKRKNIGMKFFLIIEIILVPNLFWYIMSTLIYLCLFLFGLQAHNFFALLYTYIWTKSGHSKDTPRHQQIPADTFRCFTDTHRHSLIYFCIYLMTHHTLQSFNIYIQADKFRTI